MTARSTLRSIGCAGIVSATAVLIACICLWFTAPHGVSPFSNIALIIYGTSSLGLLYSGIGSLSAGTRRPTVPWWDLQFFAGIRRLVLAMFVTVLVFDMFGILVMVMVLRVPDTGPKVGAGWLAVAFAAVVVTVVCAGFISTVARRVLPRDLAQLTSSSSIFGV